MDKIIITINTGNAAFGEPGEKGEVEVGRILRELAADIEYYNYPDFLYDINSNKVGTIDYT